MSSSSSSSVSATTVNGTTRVTGLSSGIDVDSIVTQLMTAEKTKLHKLQQQQQLAEWRQDAYRDMITDIQAFSDKYCNVTASGSLLTQKTFMAYTVTSSSTAVSATYTSEAQAGEHSVTVTQLATAAVQKTSGSLSQTLTGSHAADYTALAGKSFALSVDGQQYTVSVGSNVTDKSGLQSAIDAAVGSGKVTVAENSGILSLTPADDSGVQVLSVQTGSDAGALFAIGLTDGQSNRISTSATLETLAGSMASGFSFDTDGQVALTINGVNFHFDKDTTLSELMKEINASSAGVTMKYDSLQDALTLTANKTGAGNTLAVSESGSTFLAAALSANTPGTDSKATIDGVTLTRSSNTIAYNGVSYTLKQTSDAAATVSLTQDVDTVYKAISSFVDDYNALISTINGKLAETYDSDYAPLTDDQKSAMSEDEITKWETKAKKGLLERDDTLRSFLTNMRTALVDSIKGQASSLSSIGITTGTYEEKGKLHIDEDTLKAALQSKPTEVMNLFSQQSSSYGGTIKVRTLSSSERSIRYKEEGVGYRLYDVLQDNISTIRDSNGNKGFLIEKAGVENDASNTDNLLTEQLDALKAKIDKEQERLDNKQTALYKQYTTLETYINTMNSQLSALQSYTASS